MPPKKDIILSFFDGFEINDLRVCWLWKNALQGDGYGSVRGKLAHRISYELFNEKIPNGLEIDHLCRNRACVNPDHLEAVTHKENIRRGEAVKYSILRQRNKTHCPYGHLYSGKNLITRKTKTGYQRQCRECRCIRGRIRWKINYKDSAFKEKYKNDRKSRKK